MKIHIKGREPIDVGGTEVTLQGCDGRIVWSSTWIVTSSMGLPDPPQLDWRAQVSRYLNQLSGASGDRSKEEVRDQLSVVRRWLTEYPAADLEAFMAELERLSGKADFDVAPYACAILAKLGGCCEAIQKVQEVTLSTAIATTEEGS